MMKRFAGMVIAVLAVLVGSAGAETLRLSAMDLSMMSAGWGSAKAKQSVAGKPLKIGEQEFTDGVGTHADSEFELELDGRVERFTAKVGLDAACGSDKGSVEFIVFADGKRLWRSGKCRLGEAAKTCDVKLDGVKSLVLMVNDAKDGVHFDHADWADAEFTYAGAAPKPMVVPQEEEVILTPPAPATPRINGPTIYGVRPNSPFLYRIPATGERPMAFAAEGLPAGLKLDADTGIITGKIAERGEHKVTLTAANTKGQDHRLFRIVVGDTLSLTPSMGWNHWYTHYADISDATIRQAADVMASSGMAD